MLISILFWSLTLTGIFYQYFAPLFEDYLGIPQTNVFGGMSLLLTIVLVCIVSIGIVYDKVFRLWHESMVVAVERNPYSRLLLMPKEILLWKRCQLRILKEVSKDDPEAQKDIEFMDKWMERLMQDPKIKAQVEETEKDILS